MHIIVGEIRMKDQTGDNRHMITNLKSHHVYSKRDKLYIKGVSIHEKDFDFFHFL